MEALDYSQIRFSTATHTVPFTREGMAGKWTRWRKNKQAAAERQQAAVTEARQAATLNRKQAHESAPAQVPA